MPRLSLCLLCLIVLLIIPYFAHTQFRMGARGGGAVSSVNFSSKFQLDQAGATHSDIQKPVYTYYGGLVLQFKAGKTFIIRPAIEYFKKAWKVEANDRGRISTFRFLRNYDIDYLQVPINVLLTTPLAKGKVYIGFGPYVGYALRGTVKVYDEIFDLEFKKFNEPVYTYLPNDYTPIQFISHYSINRFDYGINGVLGYEFAFGLFIEAGVDIGIHQVSNSYERYDLQRNRTIRDPNSSVKYSIFQLGAGFMINNKRNR